MSARSHDIRLLTWVAMLSFALANPAHARRVDPFPSLGAVCRADAKPMARVELLFGLGRSHRPNVSDEQWRKFLADVVTPRFPAGLTVWSGSGQWRENDRLTHREPMRFLLIYYAPSADSEKAIESIRDVYKRRFGQTSVMRVDSEACVSF
jgi:uncharacterized protein DUF3574